MGFDGLVFFRICALLKRDLSEGRLNKINQLSDQDYLFNIYANQENKQLLISLHPNYAHITISNKKWNDLMYPTHFVSLLRKHIEDSKIVKMEQIGLDRILRITFAKRNEINEIKEKSLVIELTGKFTNLILVNDEDGKIIDSLHRIPPLAQTIRTVQPGAIYHPLPIEKKKNPFTDSVDNDFALSKQFFGISTLLEKEIYYRISNGEQFVDIINQIGNSEEIYISKNDTINEYHFIPLTHLNLGYKKHPWDEGLSIYYNDRIEAEKKFQFTHDIDKIIRREIKHNQQKLAKIEQEYQNATEYEKYRHYGDLLYTYALDTPKGSKSVTVFDELKQEEVTIKLNELMDIIQNANSYYQKYNKGKTAMIMIKEQIDKTKTEIEYLENIQIQLSENDLESIKQIRQELTNNGYLKAEVKPNDNKKKKKVEKYLPMTYTSPTGILISVGRNNLQNEYLTFELAKYNDLFMHVKDYPGAHVVIHATEIDEATLRMGANLAAYYSKARYSSSVPVDYTLIKNVKKPKNTKLGMVSFPTNKTIYIDPVKPKEKD